MSVQTLHFRVGEDAGILLMNIAQEHLLYANDVDKAIKTITDSLSGCSMDLVLKLLVGDYIIQVDVEEQNFIVTKRDDSIHTIFPKIDVFDWCRKKSIEIAKNGNDLIRAIDEKVWKIRNRGLYKTYSYKQIFDFIAGNDKAILDDLRETEEVSELILLIKVCKDYIDKSLKIRKVIDWLEKTYPEKFEKLDMDMADIWDSSHTLTTLIRKFQSMLKCDWDNFSMSNMDTELENYIVSAKEIDDVISNGIEPVDIMDNYSAGWLSPIGEYYALNGEIANMLHNQIADALQEKGVIPMYGENERDINPDAWLEQNGWVKIHDNEVHFAGCLNKRLGKENVDLTNVQIKMIYEYIALKHNSIMKLGWILEPVSAARFQMMAENLPYLYEKYFEF